MILGLIPSDRAREYNENYKRFSGKRCKAALDFHREFIYLVGFANAAYMTENKEAEVGEHAWYYLRYFNYLCERYQLAEGAMLDAIQRVADDILSFGIGRLPVMEKFIDGKWNKIYKTAAGMHRDMQVYRKNGLLARKQPTNQ